MKTREVVTSFVNDSEEFMSVGTMLGKRDMKAEYEEMVKSLRKKKVLITSQRVIAWMTMPPPNNENVAPVNTMLPPRVPPPVVLPPRVPPPRVLATPANLSVADYYANQNQTRASNLTTQSM